MQLYLATKFADVYFLFESDDGTVERVPAHKNLLAVTSNVFERMFYGELKENGDIAITDVSAAAFMEFLQYFYLSDIELSSEQVATVLYLGYKYNVKRCINACVQMLEDDLTNENVCVALSLAIRHNQKHLIQSCEMLILYNTADIFKTAGFLDSSRMALAHILKMNLLSCSEVDVFEACMAWGRPQCNQKVLSKVMVKRYLGDLYYQIRFASMTNEEFCALEAKYGDVLREDFHTITRLIARAPIELAHFNTLPRQVKWNDRASVKCNRNRNCLLAKPQRYKLDIEEKIIFSTSLPLLLGNFRCNWMSFGQNDRQNLRSKLLVEVEIIEAGTLDGENAKVLANLNANLKSASAFTIISFPQPILIRKNYFYTISISGFPEDHYYETTELQSSVIHHNSGIIC